MQSAALSTNTLILCSQTLCNPGAKPRCCNNQHPGHRDKRDCEILESFGSKTE